MLEYDLVVFSHLRWGFVFQRPQHLLSRAAQDRRVFFIEEPVHKPISLPDLDVREDESGVIVCVPQVPYGTSEDEALEVTGWLVQEFLNAKRSRDYVLWFYTPMALPAANRLRPRAVVYDCMDELSNFKFAPPVLRERERKLLERADVVFTGGYSLWEAKRSQHDNCYAMPSSVDAPHFARARRGLAEPADMVGIPHPRVGFYGVVDERMDLDLLSSVAVALPDVQFVILGPVVKIKENDLPRHQNLHYLGQKSYNDLPAYLAHWDAAMMPFALNDSTRFISPTKTPEYLAAGKPVVSTAIRDVVRPYADLNLVKIGHDAAGFAQAVRAVLEEDQSERQVLADKFISTMSWDVTWRKMEDAISRAMANRARAGLAPASRVSSPAFRPSQVAVTPINRTEGAVSDRASANPINADRATPAIRAAARFGAVTDGVTRASGTALTDSTRQPQSGSLVSKPVPGKGR
jgi:glycosyltransferase involved in cell wall biosynthesis